MSQSIESVSKLIAESSNAKMSQLDPNNKFDAGYIKKREDGILAFLNFIPVFEQASEFDYSNFKHSMSDLAEALGGEYASVNSYHKMLADSRAAEKSSCYHVGIRGGNCGGYRVAISLIYNDGNNDNLAKIVDMKFYCLDAASGSADFFTKILHKESRL